MQDNNYGQLMAEVELHPQGVLRRRCIHHAVGRSRAQSERSEEASSNGGWAEATLRKRRAAAPPLRQLPPLGEMASVCERLAQPMIRTP